MSELSLLVLCLGNPGNQFSETRHNAGFFVADALAAKYSLRYRKPLLRPYRWATVGTTLAVKPLTYMNRSGDVIPHVSSRWDISNATILIVFDQMDLPTGCIRLRRGGGDGGHRGVRSVLSCIGDRDVWKLAVGVGRPPDGVSVSDYVLGTPDEREAYALRTACDRAADLITRFDSTGPEALMNEVNRRS